VAWNLLYILCFISSLFSPGKTGPCSQGPVFLFPVLKINNDKGCIVTVVVLERSQYTHTQLKELVEKSYDCFKLVKAHHGKTVLLKPNLISSKAPSLACTNRIFIAAIAEWYLDNGARVMLGDSPAFGSCLNVCEQHGIVEALSRIPVQIVEFSEIRKIELPCGVTVPVALLPLETDLLVGLPKVKAHKQMFVTLAVKNLFGTVKGTGKAALHMLHGGNHADFSRIILDLVDLFPNQIHFADGIETMHRSGPMDGDLLTVNGFGAAKNPVALDTSWLHLLRLDCTRSPLWKAADAGGVVGSNILDIQFPLLAPQDFGGAHFIAPENLNPIRFNPLRYIKNYVRKLYLQMFEK